MAERESARERILEAACDLIAAEGIDDVRIARVAMRAGASTALVHHYFSTREELLEQALLHSFEQAGDERFAEAEDEAAERDRRPRRGDRGVPAGARPAGARLGPLGRALAARRPRARPAPARRQPLRPLPRVARRRAEARHRVRRVQGPRRPRRADRQRDGAARRPRPPRPPPRPDDGHRRRPRPGRRLPRRPARHRPRRAPHPPPELDAEKTLRGLSRSD